MKNNSEVLYYQANIGADPDFRNLKMTIEEALILTSLAKKNENVFFSIKSLDGKELLNSNSRGLDISNFQNNVKYVEESVFSKKAKKNGYIVLENFESNFLCFSERKQEYVIWTWFFHDKEFGRGIYSPSLKFICDKMEDLKNG